MTAQAHQPKSPADGVDFEGLSRLDIEKAIKNYRRHQKLQVAERSALRERVDRAYVEDAHIVSEATQKQAVRSAKIRMRLLEDEGAETYASLAALRGREQSAARAWVARLRKQNRLFTVEAQGLVLVPRVQLTEVGNLDKEVSEILVKPLLDAGEHPWAVWAWITHTTGLLSGRVPAELVKEKPQVVQKAVAVRVADIEARAGT
ncbi:hypothetical protein [Brevibacterium limosum]|uniref:hypothetical protein n=1 Tax=Brevibacterium limosum TaxID=2697565 RepID=UPI00141E67D9|nr:hypothetical protein [Brevibacterium limosum]